MNDEITKTILVIDDELAIGALIGRALEIAGHQVRCVCDSNTAIRLLRETHFDVVITDVFMPETDGIQIVVTAHQLQPHATIIAMSGGGSYMTTGDAFKVARALGASACLHKPFLPAEVVALVREAPVVVSHTMPAN